MINLCRITNESAINSYLIRDNLYRQIIGIDQINDIKLFSNEALLVATKDNKEIGLVLLQDCGNGYVNFHAGLFKEFRHKNTLDILKKTIKTIKRLVYPLHLMTSVPEENVAAWKLDEKAGFKFKKIMNINNKNYRIYVE